MKRAAFRQRPRKAKITKSGRVILSRAQYVVLCHEVWLRDHGECQVRHEGCWGKLPYFSTRWVDHIIKRSQGGSDTLENTRLGCPPCHDWADNRGGKLSAKQKARS